LSLGEGNFINKSTPYNCSIRYSYLVLDSDTSMPFSKNVPDRSILVEGMFYHHCIRIPFIPLSAFGNRLCELEVTCYPTA